MVRWCRAREEEMGREGLEWWGGKEVVDIFTVVVVVARVVVFV